MDDQTKKTFANALDNALTTVAIWEYNRLSYRLNRDQITERIKGALNSLGNLQAGNIPNYDEWDALFYHWYQPSHINLAYSLITSASADNIAINDKLRVVDFGCGALAMQFGVALATADALERMQPLSEIRIDSLDTSQSMINMGQKIWERFKAEVNKDSNLRHLRLACEIISPQVSSLTNSPLLTNPTSMVGVNRNTAWATAWQSDSWVSALHTVYDANKDDMRRSLSSIVNKLNPHKCFATTHSSSENLLQEVWDFMDYDKYHLSRPTIEPQFSGALPEITQWRKNLNSALHINHRYLDRDVTWEWRHPECMIHTKRPMPIDDDLPW